MVPGTPNPASVALLCLPCAGASATMYLRWRRALPPWLRLVPVELPGRGARMAEPFVHDFGRLVAQLGAEHAGAMRGPHLLFGHSMGALLALGLAQSAGAGSAPLAVLASGSPAPSRRDPTRFADKQGDAALTSDLRQQGGTPEAVFESPELMRLTLDTLSADYRVCESFRPLGRGPIASALHAFGGRGDDIAPERLQAWSRETTGRFTLDWFDGNHFFIQQQEAAFLEVLLRRIGSAIGMASLGMREMA